MRIFRKNVFVLFSQTILVFSFNKNWLSGRFCKIELTPLACELKRNFNVFSMVLGEKQGPTTFFEALP